MEARAGRSAIGPIRRANEFPGELMQIGRGVVLAMTLSLAGCGYNTIQTLDEQAAQAQKNIEVQLQRRSDLIGNLVETVKGQSKQELDVFKGVAQARAGVSDAITSH